MVKERIDQHTILKVDRQTDAKKLKALEIIKEKKLLLEEEHVCYPLEWLEWLKTHKEDQ